MNTPESVSKAAATAAAAATDGGSEVAVSAAMTGTLLLGAWLVPPLLVSFMAALFGATAGAFYRRKEDGGRSIFSWHVFFGILITAGFTSFAAPLAFDLFIPLGSENAWFGMHVFIGIVGHPLAEFIARKMPKMLTGTMKAAYRKFLG